MKKLTFLLVISTMLLMNSCKQKTALQYPVSKKVDTIDNYFGVKISDPYRWLENDTSSETAEWVKEQNSLTFDYLSKIPYRDKIKSELTRLWNYPRFGVPFKEGPYFFFTKNDGLMNQAVLYVRNGLNGEPRVLLDPNKLSADGTVALSSYSVSHGGKYLAYSISRSGSDWNEIRVMEIENSKVLPDSLRWVKFSGMSWQGDGFYYSRYDEPGKGMELSKKNEFHKVFFHRVGTPQKEDILVYQNPKYPLRNYGTKVTDDERFLLLYESESTSGTALYYRDLDKKNMPFKLLAPGFEYEYDVIDNVGGKLLVITNYKAPKRKLIMMDPLKPGPFDWVTIIPERDDVLESVTIAGQVLVSEYMQNAVSKSFIYNLNGRFLFEMNLPGLGTLAGFSGKKNENTAFYGFTSFTYPLTVFKYNVVKNSSEIYTRPEIGFNPEDYEVKQVFYSSKDQTTIPLFIVHKKGIFLDGKNPVLLYGYGGFNVSMTPGFRSSRLVFLENGGIYAIANLRGGGEYGEDWHKAGIKDRKQNVFDDFIAAAEYLIQEKYTSKDHLAISGGSNGGLLVAACMLQRPELFRVVIPQAGVLDMLRYHKFTIGWAWASDYGTSETKEGFNYLIKYSPLHNIKAGVDYPATLVFTADHDDRVVPAHSFKFIAALQACNKGKNPILIRVETKAGHGAGIPTSKAIEESTDFWAFIFYNLGMRSPE